MVCAWSTNIVAGGWQVLDFVSSAGARKETKEMLSNECLNGLLFDIVRDKWLRWGRFYACALAPELSPPRASAEVMGSERPHASGAWAWRSAPFFTQLIGDIFRL